LFFYLKSFSQILKHLHRASKALQLQQNSLAFLLQTYCGVTADKRYQQADWRVRPLTSEMLRYARDDTHYLLYIYNTMKAALVEKAGGTTMLVEEVLRASELVALYQYVKPVFDVDGYKALLVQYPRDLQPQDEVIYCF
jgi:exosome complex exonuclease RRP6